MNTIVGNCIKCGAPIYAPAIWQGITPPPSSYSCNCYQTCITVSTDSSDATTTKLVDSKSCEKQSISG